MIFPGAIFNIIEENNCPLYHAGDVFKLTDNIIYLPSGKPACLTLMLDMTEVLYNYENIGSSEENLPYEFKCSGCKGIARLEFFVEQLPATALDKKDGEVDAIANHLRNFSFFKSLGEQNIRELVSMLKIKRYCAGDIVIRKGEPGKNLFIILSGMIEVVGDDGIRITTLGKGEVFGEMSLLSGDPVGATIRVVEPGKIIFMSSKDFRKVLNQYPPLQLYFARLLARRLAKTNVEMSEELASGMVGKLSEMPPSELLQTLNVNQKTGVLTLNLPKDNATLCFRDGNLINAVYADLKGKEAFYAILKEKEGRFKFSPELPYEEAELPELGDFMWLLMEGVRRADEDESQQ